MKVAITCDHVLEKNHYADILRMVCELYPEAKLYTFVHREKAVLGSIEQRNITSTFLSKIIKTEDQYLINSFKLPSLSDKIFVSCEYDLIINLSKGFSQGFKKCDRSKMITYLYELDLKKRIFKTFVQKFFYLFTKNWIMNSLKKADVLLVANEQIKIELMKSGKFSDMEIDVILPPFRLSDYSLFPKEMFPHHFFGIETIGLDINSAREIARWMKEWDLKFQFIGADDHLIDLKKEFLENIFFGERCSGEHTPVLASTLGFISLNNTEFPNLVLGTLATGRPVIIKKEMEKWVNSEGVFSIDHLSKAELKKAIDQLINAEPSLEGAKLRAQVNKYHDIKFKSFLSKIAMKTIN